MRKLTWAGMGLIILMAYGCSRGDQILTPGGPGQAIAPAGYTLGAPIIEGDAVSSSLGLFTFTVDTANSTAEALLARKAESTNNLYELSIEAFVSPESVKVESVDVTPTTVDLRIRVTHPIPAPTNLDGPATAANRADLGAALRLLLLQDVDTPEGNTYFASDEPVILNSRFVANADGYFTPRGLVQLPSNIQANTFPYLMVVDEAANDGTGNRDGISGVPGSFGLGNYAPEQGGWQRHNIGPSNNGWTGFGILHGGQSAIVHLRLNRADMVPGDVFSFDGVLLAKYLDPRGGATTGEKRANRLPTADGDPAAFSYRMPYGALDCASVKFIGETGGWRPNEATNTTFRFSVLDWDALAGETTLPDLGDEPNINLIQIGGSGFPAIWLDVPGMIASPVEITGNDLLHDDSPFGGDPTPDSGVPGDLLVYSKTVAKNISDGEMPGNVTGLLRVIDPEDSARSAYTTPVDADLQPLPATQVPRAWTYQTIPFLVANPNGTPNATGQFIGGATAIISGQVATAQILSYTDAENNPGSFTIDYDTTGGFFPDFPAQTITTGGPFPASLPQSPQLNNNSSVSTITRMAEIRYTDNLHPPRSIYIPYTLSGNNPPSANITLPYEEYVIGSSMELIIANLIDPEGNPILFEIDWEWDGTEGGFHPDTGYNNVNMQQALTPRAANSNPGSWLIGIRITDPLHPNGPIITIPYATVPPNTPPVATFSTPGTVESATSTRVICDSFFDPDLDDVEIEIDWNGDGDFADAGESGLAPLLGAGQEYTSPVLYNNTSASPLPARTINIRYTDNVAPHDWIETTAGQYILGGNRPPVISGTLTLKESPLSPPAIFEVQQNNALWSDPEGNPITFTLRSVPNSGSANNVSFTSFPRVGPTYINPPVHTVTMTVYANDALHATTSGTPWPALVGTVCPTYVATWNFDSSNDGWIPGFGGLPNTDGTNWSQWTWCPVLPGQGLSGSHWTTGPDVPGPCTNHPDDYATSVNNNLVSPIFSLAGLTKANLVWNSSYNGRGGTTCHYRIFVSTDGGANWTQIFDHTKSSATKVNSANQFLSLNNFVGNSAVRVRFQLQDTHATETWGASPYAGWSIDAVRVTGCP